MGISPDLIAAQIAALDKQKAALYADYLRVEGALLVLRQLLVPPPLAAEPVAPVEGAGDSHADC